MKARLTAGPFLVRQVPPRNHGIGTIGILSQQSAADVKLRRVVLTKSRVFPHMFTECDRLSPINQKATVVSVFGKSQRFLQTT